MQKSKDTKQKFFNTVVVNFVEYNEDSDFYTPPAPSAVPAMPDVRYIVGYIVPIQDQLFFLYHHGLFSDSFNIDLMQICNKLVYYAKNFLLKYSKKLCELRLPSNSSLDICRVDTASSLLFVAFSSLE